MQDFAYFFGGYIWREIGSAYVNAHLLNVWELFDGSQIKTWRGKKYQCWNEPASIQFSILGKGILTELMQEIPPLL